MLCFVPVCLAAVVPDRNVHSVAPAALQRTVRAACRVMGVTAAICYDHELVHQGIISKQFEIANLDLAPVSITSFALSLLLVFRTNTSYSRFDEARKFWGLALNRSRDLVRMAVTFFPKSNNPGMSQHITAKLARWTIAWTIALKCHLRPNENLRQEASAVLSEDELALLMSSDHKVRT